MHDCNELSAYYKPHETALQLYSRTWTEPINTSLPFLDSVRSGDVVEISGPNACGKTTLLLQVAVNAILPSRWLHHRLGGLQENAIFIDLDNKFDILRLLQILHARVQASIQQDTEQNYAEAIDAIIHASLARFYLVRCGSSFELLAFLRVARPLVANLQAKEGLHLILIDNIAAFHWLDTSVKSSGKHVSSTDCLSLAAVHTALAASIRMLAKQLKQCIIVTKHAFKSYAGQDEVAVWQHREVMNRPWADIVSQRLLLKPLEGGVGDLPLKLGAKWDKPSSPLIHTFAITDAGIEPSAW